jgi:hypothetical protein
MTVTFQKAERKNIGLLLMLAGGTGSGKTWSGMELAQGMAGGQRFAACDTERGRASMYADTFDFDVLELDAPFRPDRYLDVVLAAEEKGYPVLLIDSMSHEWEGAGGLLDWHEDLMGGNQSKNLSAWIEPKMAHRKFVSRLLQARLHIIMCFRAAERVEVERKNGKMEIVPKKSLTGLAGWLPITEKNLPFEATASFMLMAEKPGVPQPIKLPEPLKGIVPLDRPLSAETGEALARWAGGEKSARSNGRRSSKASKLTTELLGLAEQLGKREEVAEAVDRHRQGMSADPARHEQWLEHQVERARGAVAELDKATAILSGVGAEGES